MILRCAIVDDEPLAISILEDFVGKIPNIEIVATFNDPILALNFISENEVDLLFLDIEMPNLSGIDMIKSLINPPLVIIISANKNYAIEGYELNVVDYLMKPITFERVIKSIGKLTEIHKQKGQDPHHKDIDDFIFLKENKRMVKVYINDILLVESIKDYIKVTTKDKTITTKQNLTRIEQFLVPKGFLRVHKSFIVALSKVDAFSSSIIEIGLFKIPIGRIYKDEVLFRLGDIKEID